MPECRIKDDSSHCVQRIYNLLEILKTPVEFLIEIKQKKFRRNFHPHSTFLILHSKLKKEEN